MSTPNAPATTPAADPALPTGGADPGTGAQVPPPAAAAGSDDGGENPMVARVRAELAKERQRAKALEDSLAARKLEEMKKNQQWQEIAEQKEREAQSAREEADRLKKSLVIDRKSQVVREAALKAGIRKEALNDLDLIDLDDVAIETTSTGRVNVIGADRAVQKLKTLRPHWFGQPAPGVNPETPGVSSATSNAVTYADIAAAEAKAKKTGDSSEYLRLLRAYQAQSRAAGRR